ncbi:PilX N-terminal domain-containing pilus assembly protein [Marinobacter sp. VGCF2001]|uniref:PilX N-terminal domain-containing pilus assembly protein n=1 Tax=Marinobacter sp. VGCF2001 TaxID=3417189 RepID=UPI003CEC287F
MSQLITPKSRYELPKRQQGAALLVSLVILLVLTVLALSSMQGTSTQERMVSAQRDAQIALEGAEAALLAAEAELSGGTLPTFNANEGLYDDATAAPTDLLNPQTWETPSGGGHGNGTREAPMPQVDGDNMLAERPRYLIKETPATGSATNSGFGLGIGGVADGVQQSTSNGRVFRVVAYSSGASGEAGRAVEAYVIRAQ